MLGMLAEFRPFTTAPGPASAPRFPPYCPRQLHDTNGDGFHSKKEFYYAIMEDEFEALASKHNKVGGWGESIHAHALFRHRNKALAIASQANPDARA
jgi:hypothetical protein